MKLKYYLDKNKKIYTLKEKINNKEILPAHYKFIKIKSSIS
jgi:hypothetical protein